MRTILDIDTLYGDIDQWEEELKQIEKEWKNYIIVSPLQPRQKFPGHECIINEINNISFQTDFVNALYRKRPFANFKVVIDDSDYRKKWYEFRQTKMKIM